MTGLVAWLVTALAPGLATTVPAEAAAAAPQRTATVTAATVTATGLYANATGLVMDAGGARKSGVTVRLRRDSGAHGKRWLRERDATIRPAYDTKLCLSVPRARYQSGTSLQVMTCRGLKSQRFTSRRPSRSTPFFFISPAGDRRLCLSQSFLSFTPGDPVILDLCGSPLTAAGLQVWATGNLATRVGQLDSTPGTPLPLQDTALGVAGDTPGSPAIAARAWSLPLGSEWEAGTENVAPFGEERVLHPASNTALCLTRAGVERAGTPLRLERCTGSAAQGFTGIQVGYNSYHPVYFLSEPDGRFCVTISGGARIGHHVLLGHCAGTAADTWTASTWTRGIDLTAAQSGQYQELYPGQASPRLSLSLTRPGRGAKAVLAEDRGRASQVWTDLRPPRPGLTGLAGNADGSISLRPLSDTGLCLTVPGARYAVGQRLAVQPCDGNHDQEFLRVPSVSFNGVPYQELAPYGDGRLCAGLSGGAKAGAAVVLKTCTGTLAQAWEQMLGWYGWGGEPPGLYPYELSAPPTAALAASGLTSATGVAVTQPYRIGDLAQAWVPGKSADGLHETYRLAARAAWCLTTPSTAAVTVRPCDSTASQEFSLNRVLGPDGIAYQQVQSVSEAGLCLSRVTGSGSVPVALASCQPGDLSELWYPGAWP